MGNKVEKVDKQVLQLFLEQSEKNLQASVDSRDKISRKYLIYCSFCIGYIAFMLNLISKQSFSSEFNFFFMATILLQLFVFLVLVFKGFITSDYSNLGFHPKEMMKESNMFSSLNCNINKALLGTAEKIDINKNVNHKRTSFINLVIKLNFYAFNILLYVTFYLYFYLHIVWVPQAILYLQNHNQTLI